MFLLSFLVGSGLAVSEPRCPKFSVAFDFQPCDPKLRSQCPGGFTCRRANDTANPSNELYLCCDNTVMNVDDWFTESGLIPAVLPQFPQARLRSVRLTPVDQSSIFPPVHIGDEVVVLSYENYTAGRVVMVEFEQPPASGGYLHVLTVVDGGYRPTALLLTYNIAANGSPLVDTSSQATQSQVTFVDNSTMVPKRAQYRAQYATLAFRTPFPIGMTTNGQAAGPIDAATLMNGCSDVTCLLSNTTIGRDLGQPIGGTLFYLTTRTTLFAVDPDSPENSSSSTTLLSFLFIALLSDLLI